MNDIDDATKLTFLAHAGRRYFSNFIASSAFLVYDWLTTLDKEVEFVWGSPNALPKYLYFVSRYFGLIGQLFFATNLTPYYCPPSLIASSVYIFIVVVSVEISLMLRIDALYTRSRPVRLLMGVAFMGEIVTTVLTNALSLPHIMRISVPNPPSLRLKGCIFPTEQLPLYKLFWLPILAFETLLFILNTAKCISYGPLAHAPLILRLFRDGSVYYVLIFVFMLLLLITEFFDGNISSALVSWMTTVFSYGGCHLLLSVRQIAAQRVHLDRSSADMTMGMGIDIDPPAAAAASLPASTHCTRSRRSFYHIASIDVDTAQTPTLSVSSERICDTDAIDLGPGDGCGCEADERELDGRNRGCEGGKAEWQRKRKRKKGEDARGRRRCRGDLDFDLDLECVDWGWWSAAAAVRRWIFKWRRRTP